MSSLCHNYLMCLESRVHTGGAWQLYVENSVQEIKVGCSIPCSRTCSLPNHQTMADAHVIATSHCTIQTAIIHVVMAQLHQTVSRKWYVSERILPVTERIVGFSKRARRASHW
jgi:hypothetical protein